MKLKTSIIHALILTLLASISLAGEQVTANLGTKDLDFGSTGQAMALQQIMQESPGSTRYQIEYTTSGDVVIFGCDLDKDVIARMHNRPDGHGTSEVWQGDVLHRIKSAAEGGSLNDTQGGKVFGTMQTF